jgi:ketosteroid isomerase-like protein
MNSRTLVVLILSLVPSVYAKKNLNGPANDLRAIEHSFREDAQNIALTQLDHLLADDYTSSDAQGNKIDKKQTLEMFKTAKEKRIQFPPATLGELNVTVNGNTAFVVGTYKLQLEGAPEHEFTDAFRNNKKEWQLVSSKEQAK